MKAMERAAPSLISAFDKKDLVTRIESAFRDSLPIRNMRVGK